MAGQLSASKERKYFANSEGSYIIQERTVTGLNCQAFSEGQQGRASRYFPHGKAGHYSTGGLESIDSLDLYDLGQQAGAEATELVTAPPAPTGDMDVILTGSQMAALLHETCGRFAELDWNLGLDGSDSIQRVISPENIEQFRFGSPLVTITADASIHGGMGSFGYDDEGFPADQLTLVDNGIWSGFLANREHKGILPRSNQSIHSSRADGFNRSPQIRMSNVSLSPGQGTMADLIRDTEHGIIIDSPIQFVMDPIRGWFRCVGEIGWEIERGEKRQMVRSPAYEGQITYFWQSCDAICGEDDRSLFCYLDSSRGYPTQSVASSHGASPCRFRGVRVDTAKPW
jgi:TldD protein